MGSAQADMKWSTAVILAVLGSAVSFSLSLAASQSYYGHIHRPARHGLHLHGPYRASAGFFASLPYASRPTISSGHRNLLPNLYSNLQTIDSLDVTGNLGKHQLLPIQSSLTSNQAETAGAELPPRDVVTSSVVAATSKLQTVGKTSDNSAQFLPRPESNVSARGIRLELSEVGAVKTNRVGVSTEAQSPSPVRLETLKNPEHASPEALPVPPHELMFLEAVAAVPGLPVAELSQPMGRSVGSSNDLVPASRARAPIKQLLSVPAVPGRPVLVE